MCLIINKNMENKKPNKDGFCVAWKVITRNNYAYYYNYAYKIGKNCPENRLFRPLDELEKKSGFVALGLHAFLTRDSCRAFKKERIYCDHDHTKIIKVYYKPEDVIAYGNWECESGFPSVVLNALTVKSLKGE